MPSLWILKPLLTSFQYIYAFSLDMKKTAICSGIQRTHWYWVPWYAGTLHPWFQLQLSNPSTKSICTRLIRKAWSLSFKQASDHCIWWSIGCGVLNWSKRKEIRKKGCIHDFGCTSATPLPNRFAHDSFERPDFCLSHATIAFDGLPE